MGRFLTQAPNPAAEMRWLSSFFELSRTQNTLFAKKSTTGRVMPGKRVTKKLTGSRRYISKELHAPSAVSVQGLWWYSILISTMPRDQTSAARGLYVGATLFLHSKLMYGALPQSMSEDSRSVVERPKSVSLTMTRRSSRPSGSVIHPSVTMKFSGLMSR